jgi:hypothetical protein
MEPPRRIPQCLYSEFTMGKRVKVEYIYQDNSFQGGCTRIYKKEMIDSYLQKIKQKETFYYGATDACLYKALERHSINEKKVAILGSQCPLYESICLFYGGSPTTIEYQKIISEDNRLTVMTVEEYSKKPILFDAAFSISSFEHDGLGRYGDLIAPEGDFQAMTKMKSIIKKGGLLFLSVPIGKDMLVWNLHRVYGKLRLPKLLHGWKIINIYHDWNGFDLSNRGNYGGCSPVFVLKNSDTGEYNLNYFLDIMEAVGFMRQFFRKIKGWIKIHFSIPSSPP